MAKSSKKRVYARIINIKLLIWYQFVAIMTGLVANMAITVWQNELTRLQIEGMYNKTTTAIAVCNEIGWDNCKKARDIIKERKDK